MTWMGSTEAPSTCASCSSARSGYDMGGDAGLWTRLLDDPPEEIDRQWRAISARDLYEAGYAPQGAPEPPIQHLEPLGDAGDPAWADVYMALVGGAE